MTTRRGPRTFARRWDAYVPHLPTPGRALDLGADAGQFSAALADLGWRVLAVEAQPLAIAYPRVEVLHRRLDAAGIHSLARPARFDLALALSFLHWQRDWASCFVAICAAARVALIEVPHPDERRGEALRRMYDRVLGAGDVIHEELCWRGRYLRPTVRVVTP